MRSIDISSLSKRASAQATLVLIVLAAVIPMSLVKSANAADDKSAVSATGSCPPEQSVASLSALGSVYLGELHGTNESPRLLECLVDYEVAHYKVANGKYPLTVSLELQPFARDTNALIWSGPDGRASKAMAHAVDHLESLEKSGQIVLNFQLPNYPVPELVDEQIGTGLRDLASKGRVIAFGGNFHAQRRQVMLPGNATRPAGSYMGQSIKNVLIDSTGPGEASGCSQNSCGIYKTQSFVADGKLGSLVDGQKFGYDYIYFVAPYTPSTPKFPPVVQKTTK